LLRQRVEHRLRAAPVRAVVEGESHGGDGRGTAHEHVAQEVAFG